MGSPELMLDVSAHWQRLLDCPPRPPVMPSACVAPFFDRDQMQSKHCTKQPGLVQSAALWSELFSKFVLWPQN
eukprot:1138403-Pelagomonas_calceolata.AAC.2